MLKNRYCFLFYGNMVFFLVYNNKIPFFTFNNSKNCYYAMD